MNAALQMSPWKREQSCQQNHFGIIQIERVSCSNLGIYLITLSATSDLWKKVERTLLQTDIRDGLICWRDAQRSAKQKRWRFSLWIMCRTGESIHSRNENTYGTDDWRGVSTSRKHWRIADFTFFLNCNFNFDNIYFYLFLNRNCKLIYIFLLVVQFIISNSSHLGGGGFLCLLYIHLRFIHTLSLYSLRIPTH